MATKIKQKTNPKIQKIQKKTDTNKKIYEKAKELNSFAIKFHCSINQISSSFLHELREKILPGKILFGKKSVMKKIFDFQFEKNSFIVFCDSENKNRVQEILKNEKIFSYPEINSESEIEISEGKLPFPSSMHKIFKTYNLDVEVVNGDLFLRNSFKWSGKVNRNILNLFKLLKFKSISSNLRILDIVE